MIEDTEKWKNEAAYGFAFETLMTTCPDKNLKDCYFYRNICFELDGLTLLVGFEVDCCFNNPPNYSSIELKTHNVRYEPNWLDYWETLVLSDTKYLCVGSIDKSDGSIVKITKKQVHELLPPDHEAVRNRFSQLREVLGWVKDQFDQLGGMTGSLTYNPKDTPNKMTLKITG
jgi:hypothetical protein